MENDPNDWERHEDYCEARDWVRTAKVVNDSCERAVKLIQDYCTTLTTDSELRRGLLKGVQASREQFPDFNKSTLDNIYE